MSDQKYKILVGIIDHILRSDGVVSAASKTFLEDHLKKTGIWKDIEIRREVGTMNERVSK